MGEGLKTLAKARMELEQLYLGIPDDSVNLTFQDLADVQHKANASSKSPNPPATASPLSKLPSLDFKRGLQAAPKLQHHHNHSVVDRDHHHQQPWRHSHHHHDNVMDDQMTRSPAAYDDVSLMSMASIYRDVGDNQSRRRRPGIPHSNICTICTTCIYKFRHRCLVCGWVYCRHCVSMGMGEMTKGRKCIHCLGRRFNQRYIKRAGKVGCCWRYGNAVKQAEIKWAEKGPRRSGERGMVWSPTSRSRAYAGNIIPSFVASSPVYSPYATPTHLHLPL